MRIALVAMSGVRVQNEELMAAGLTLAADWLEPAMEALSTRLAAPDDGSVRFPLTPPNELSTPPGAFR